MQASQSSSSARRAVGLPSNPRQGRSLPERASQPVLTARNVRWNLVSGDSRSTAQEAGSQREPRRLNKLPATPRSINSLPSNPRSRSTSSATSSLPRRPIPQAAPAQSRRSNLDTYEVPDPPISYPARNVESQGPRVGEPQNHDTQTLVAPIWKTVTSLANSLTVNVAVAWSSNVISKEGEDTPLGAESRLTRAMKAYYLNKAEDHSDLPAWLFTDRERRSRAVVVQSNQSEVVIPPMNEQRPRQRAPNVPRVPIVQVKPPNSQGSNATDRLQALRARQREGAKRI